MNTGMSTKRSPLKFFLLVFTLCVPFWVLSAITGIQLLTGLPISSVVVISPVTAALILVYRENGLAGMAGLLKRSFDFKRIKAKIWYVPVVLLMPVVTILSYGLMRLMGSPVPTPQISLLAPLVLFLIFFIFGLGEELGWMGYAVDPMQERWGALRASIVLGLVWAAWHIIPVIQAGQSLGYIVWLYNNTWKSVFAAAVYHSMLNITWQLFPINGSYYDPRITGLIVAFAALLVTVMWGSQTLTQYRYARSNGRTSAEESKQLAI